MNAGLLVAGAQGHSGFGERMFGGGTGDCLPFCCLMSY